MICYQCLLFQAATVGVLVTIVLYLRSTRKTRSLTYGLPPVLPTIPLLGHAHLILYGMTGMVNLIVRSAVQFYGTRSGNVTVLWLGFYPLVLVVGPADVQMVLNSDKALDKGPEMDDLKIFLGNGLLTSPGHHWKVIRRHFNPLFKPHNLEFLVLSFNECGRELVADLTPLVDRGQVDILEIISSVALKAAILLVFGSEAIVNRQSRTFLDLLKALDSVHRLIYSRFMKIWLWPEVSFRLLYKKQLQEIDKSISNFMEERIKVYDNIKPEEINIEDEFNNADQSENMKEQLRQITLPEAYNVLRHNYPGFTKEALQYEVTTFLTAGTEGVKATVASCLLALATNPQVQERLQKEIMSKFGGQDMEVTVKDIKDMPYLDQVLKETMRKFWIAPIVPRTLTEEITLSCGPVPAGTTLYMMPSVAHSDHTYYPSPETFDPDRFTPESVAEREPFTYLPYGAGPRMCIAKNYSTLLMKILIIHILRRFRLSSNQDLDNLTYKPGAIYLSVNGYKVQFSER